MMRDVSDMMLCVFKLMVSVSDLIGHEYLIQWGLLQDFVSCHPSLQRLVLQVGKTPERGETGIPAALSGTSLEIQPG